MTLRRRHRRHVLLHVHLLLLFLVLAVVLPQLCHSQPADFTLYHSSEELLTQCAQIAQRNPAYVRALSCASSSSAIPYYSVTAPPALSHVGAPKLRLLLNFGEHGRELITSEIALAFLRIWDVEARQHEREAGQKAAADDVDAAESQDDEFSYARYTGDDVDVSDEYMSWLLRNAVVVVVPLLNAWGRQQVEAGVVCSRKSRNGVDLNRNWDFMFEHNTRRPDEETYQGAAAFSEDESRCVRDIAVELRPHVYVNVHSGIEELYFGWDHRGDVQLPNQREVSRLYEHVNAFHCSCKVGSAGKIAGYVVHGGSMDYMYDRLNVSYSLTYEVYGDTAAQPAKGQCYAAYNPVTPAGLQDTVRRFSTSFLSMTAFLIEEKLGVIFPYRPPSFALTPLFLRQDAKERNAVRLYYHPWRLMLPHFPSSSASLPPGSAHPLPLLDADKVLARTDPAPSQQLRVLVVADMQWNHHFSSELVLHLKQQMSSRHWRRRLQLVLIPTLFPRGRALGELCWDGLSAAEQRDRRREQYQGEEELERVTRHMRPHLVLSLHQSNVTADDKRSRLEQFDVAYVNSSHSDAAFTAAVLAAVSSSAAIPLPFSSPLSLSTLLHLRLTYRGRWEEDVHAERRRQRDRLPPSAYLTHDAPPHRLVHCDWPRLNPPPGGLRAVVSDAMRQLHRVLEALSELRVDVTPVVAEESEESDGRRMLFMAELMAGDLVRDGPPPSWLPNVWQQGVSWKGWLLLAVLVATTVTFSLIGWQWIRQRTKQLKATQAV